jgi:subfamily B ATP-binding cassette protein MsbA
LKLNNFFSFLAAMMLAYQPIRSLATINMAAYQGAAAAKRIYRVLIKK